MDARARRPSARDWRVTSLLVGWQARSFAYRCGACEHVFQVSALVDFIGPQSIDRGGQGQVRGWKLLRCPACHAWRRCSVVRPPARGNGAPNGEL